MKPIDAFFWRKLDHPGHDSCRLFKMVKGWRLSGTAVLWDEGRACHFQYEVLADLAWRTRRARVTGYFGTKAIDTKIAIAGKGRWRVNGTVQNNLTGCVDVDLGFTPSTNLIALRRLSLKVGQSADAPAAYLAFPQLKFMRLPQQYHRISVSEYHYESPTFGYTGTLKVLSSGAIVHYPGLFELVESG